MEQERTPYGDPPDLEPWIAAMTNSPTDLALQLRRHAIRRLKQDTRWVNHVTVAEKILRERRIKWE